MESILSGVFIVGAVVVGGLALLLGVGLIGLLRDNLDWFRENWGLLTIAAFTALGRLISGDMGGALAGLIFGVGVAVILWIIMAIIQEIGKSKEWQTLKPKILEVIAKWNGMPTAVKIPILALLIATVPFALETSLVLRQLNKGELRVGDTSSERPSAKTKELPPPNQPSGKKAGDRPKSDGFEKPSDFVEALTDWKLRSALRRPDRVPAKSTIKPKIDDFETFEEFVDSLSDWKIAQALVQTKQGIKKYKPSSPGKPNPESYEKYGAYVEALMDWKLAQIF